MTGIGRVRIGHWPFSEPSDGDGVRIFREEGKLLGVFDPSTDAIADDLIGAVNTDASHSALSAGEDVSNTQRLV